MGELELDTLESKGLIRLATIQPELEYLFRHALVQDAAYESLLKQERRTLHRQVGDALENLYPERHGELAAVLARHFEQAGEPDKAIEYLVEAARFAYERHAVQETFELLTRARDLLPPGSPDDSVEVRTRRVEIEFGRQKAGFSILSSEETARAMGPLLEEVDRLNNPRLAADVHLHAALLMLYSREGGESNPAIQRSLDRVAEIATELNDPYIGAMPNSIIGLFKVFTGRLAEGVEMLQLAAPVLAQHKDSIGSSFARMALGIGLARMGRFDEAEAAIDVAMEVAERGDLVARLDSRIGRAIVRQTRGDEDSAILLAHECVALAEETGATACLISSSNVLGDSLMQATDFPAARIAYERGSTVADVTGERMFRPSLTASLRSVAASMGEFNPVGTDLRRGAGRGRFPGRFLGACLRPVATRPDGIQDADARTRRRCWPISKSPHHPSRRWARRRSWPECCATGDAPSDRLATMVAPIH